MSPNVLSISEVPSEARNLGEGEARTRYTLLSEGVSPETTVRGRRVGGKGKGLFSCIFFIYLDISSHMKQNEFDIANIISI